jgi:dolichol-phosphate mannosyltransferase
MKTKISIIIPTYNEGLGILLFLEKIKKELRKLLDSYKPEIIVIDDNSPDGTSEIIQSRYTHNKYIKVYIRKRIRGLATAIGFGIKRAKGKIIIGMDADGNHDVKKIKILLNNIKENDLVVASRFVKPVLLKSLTSEFRHFGSFIFNLFLKLFLHFPIWDNTSGFYAIEKKNLERLGLKKIYYGYGDYHLRLVFFAKLKKYRIKEIPCVYPKRIAGISKSNFFIMFKNYLEEAFRLKFFFS